MAPTLALNNGPAKLPPTSDQLMQFYRQEEESDYVATLLILFIDAGTILRFHSVEREFPNHAKPDIACDYNNKNAGLVFEIKSKREMSAVAAYEMEQVVRQIVRYSTTFNGWSERIEELKEYCDVVLVVNSNDVQQLESEVTSRLLSLDNSTPRLRANGLAFCGWERTEVLPSDELKVRYYKGAVSDDPLLSPLKDFNGYHFTVHKIASERNERNIHLEIQSEHRLIILIMEKVWGIYDFRATLHPRQRVRGTAAEDYFVDKGKIYFTIECLDFHFHWNPSSKAYCSKVKREKLRHACEQMHRLGLVDKQEVNGRTHFGLSLNRKEHDYPRDVCEGYAQMIQHEYDLEQKKLEEKVSRGQRGMEEFFT